MILLLLAIALTDAEQTVHDGIERQMRHELLSAHDAIELEWRPSKRTLKAYALAEKCYADFHLYRAKACDAKLDALHRDVTEDQAREEASR